MRWHCVGSAYPRRDVTFLGPLLRLRAHLVRTPRAAMVSKANQFPPFLAGVGTLDELLADWSANLRKVRHSGVAPGRPKSRHASWAYQCRLVPLVGQAFADSRAGRCGEASSGLVSGMGIFSHAIPVVLMFRYLRTPRHRKATRVAAVPKTLPGVVSSANDLRPPSVAMERGVRSPHGLCRS